ncbi:MAG TPA: hypothetical protein PKW55_03650 [Spirochaetota bacterium]|nr:hypothetical protein [Spirochaetota bacterium]HOM38071.1 hypothetical protein [Spirochaetota bacterium]HPQ48874.1 hypothetical protein [Spirochaetota bacterium]
MEKRGPLYFTILSLFFYNLLFSKIIISDNQISINDIFKKLKSIEKEKKDNEYKLVEVFIEDKKKENTLNLAQKESRKGGKKIEDKEYSYYNNVRFIGKISENIERYTKEESEKIKESINDKNNNTEKTSSKMVDILPNLYRHEKITINIDTENNISIDAEKFEHTDYLIKIANDIFYKVIEFIPAFQISKGFISSEGGIISGSIGIYFKDNTFDIIFITPFKSPNMNAIMIRAFSYINIQKAPDDLKLNFLIFSLKVYTSNLKVEGSFKFDLHYKGKRY